jgi:LPXTG-motif cell wall-anchored protein
MGIRLSLSFLMFLATVSCLAGGTSAVAPEIDPTTGGAAIALLGGGLLVIRYRRKR